MFTVYIIYSTSADRYYIGFTGDSMEFRLKKHLASHKGYTGKFKDWKIAYTEKYIEKQAAMKREKEIKCWKSRTMIEKLIGSTE